MHAITPTPSIWPAAWLAVTRLGEALILLPAMGAALVWLWRSGAHTLAWRWAAATGLAAALTTATKVAFLGFGLGLQPADFTGVSGHAMFAAVVLPVLGQVLAAGARAGFGIGFALGCLAASVVAVSRVVVGAHSPSEVAAGALLGLAAAAACLRGGAPPAEPHRVAGPRAPAALGWLLALWVVAMPAGAPPSPTHGWVVRLSLALSGRHAPYSRATAWPARASDAAQPRSTRPPVRRTAQPPSWPTIRTL